MGPRPTSGDSSFGCRRFGLRGRFRRDALAELGQHLLRRPLIHRLQDFPAVVNRRGERMRRVLFLRGRLAQDLVSMLGGPPLRLELGDPGVELGHPRVFRRLEFSRRNLRPRVPRPRGRLDQIGADVVAVTAEGRLDRLALGGKLGRLVVRVPAMDDLAEFAPLIHRLGDGHRVLAIPAELIELAEAGDVDDEGIGLLLAPLLVDVAHLVQADLVDLGLGAALIGLAAHELALEGAAAVAADDPGDVLAALTVGGAGLQGYDTHRSRSSHPGAWAGAAAVARGRPLSFLRATSPASLYILIRIIRPSDQGNAYHFYGMIATAYCVSFSVRGEA